MPSGLEAAGFSRPDAVNAVTLYLGAMFAGSLGCGFLPVARKIYPVVGTVYLTGLWIWMEGLGGFAGLMGAALVIMMAGAWASTFGFGRMPVLLMILVLMWCVVAWLVAGRPDATGGAPRRKCACLP